MTTELLEYLLVLVSLTHFAAYFYGRARGRHEGRTQGLVETRRIVFPKPSRFWNN